MKKFGLIGHPIEHSLSPALFKAGYDGKYPYELIETADFEEAYSRFMEEYDGINVTAPFKEPALQKADIISEECRITGAANLLIKTPEGVKAYNSDYRGIRLWLSSALQGLKSVLPPWPQGEGAPRRGRQGFFSVPVAQTTADALIIGFGGAGKAAACAAEAAGMHVTILNRTCKSPGIRPLSDFREEFRKADVIIYNLPVRIPELDLLTEEDCASGKAKVILEANYRNPAFDNELLEKLTGWNPLISYEEGETWLLMQAVTGYELFTGEKPDAQKMRSIIKSK